MANGSDDKGYDDFLRHRNLLIDVGLEQTKSFDKQVLALASAALGVSIVFLKDVAPHPTACTRGLLYVSWILLLLSLVCTLVSFLVAARAFDKERECWDKAFPNQPPPKKTKFSLTKTLNWTSCVAFILGVGFLCWFAGANI